MRRFLRGTTLTATLALLAACGGSEQEPAVVADTAVVAEPGTQTGQMQGMQGMGGMQGMQQGGPAAELQAHMRMMQNASGEELKRMVPEHRQMVANMIAQFNREMREMNMAEDSEWGQTVKALRDDLVRLPEMSPDELKSFIPEHQTRINRLIEMHQSMMGNMNM